MIHKLTTKNKKILTLLAVVVGVIVIGAAMWTWYDYRIGGPAFRAAEQRCGTDPVAGFTSKGPRRQYITPSSDAYRPPSGMYDVYFCSIDEAKEAGYERWIYN